MTYTKNMRFPNPMRLLILLNLVFSISHAQTPAALLGEFNHNYPQEKIHLHFDKNEYVAGETLWFKAYLLSDLLPDTISSSLMAEIVNSRGTVIARKNLPVFDGTATGNFDLPDSLSQGFYTIRAYTGWMLNFDASFIFSKNIFIYNTTTAAVQKSQGENKYTVDFFPEGGNITADVVNYIAFKGTDVNGYPVSFSGSIVDSKGNDLTDIKTLHNGMGKFTLLAQNDEKYSARIKFEDGKTVIIPLPSAQPGVALHIDNDSKNIKISLSRSSDDSKEKRSFTLLGQMENHVLFETDVTLEGESTSINVSEVNYPTGILQVTLFTPAGEPLKERLTFINNEDYKLKGIITYDTLNVTPKGKNVFTFTVPDSTAGSYSISITDAGKTLNGSNIDNIISRFLLSSDIKGYVHEPAYYFMNNDKVTRTALDLIMMTNGWRRFKWDQVIKHQLPKITYKPLPYIHISGKAYAENKRDLITEGDLNFIIKVRSDSSTALFTTPIDSRGNFNADSLIFRDTAVLFFNYNTTKKSRKQVYLKLNDGALFPVLENNFLPAVYNVESNNPKLDSLKTRLKRNREELVVFNENQLKTILLQEIKINIKKKSPAQLVNERYTSSIFSVPNAYKTLDLINNKVPNITNLITYIRNQIPSVDIIGAPGNQKIVSSLGGTSLTGGERQVTTYLDQFETDFNSIQYIPVDEIALVKFITHFTYAPAGGPALLIYRKTPGDMAETPSNYISNFKFAGYSVTREFYSPNYDVPAANKNTTDIRTTLYWNPEIILDKSNQKATLRFFNSDNCRSMNVVIEGFNKGGKLCRIDKLIKM